MSQDAHLSDEQILRNLEGEGSANDAKIARAHLDACWRCRARRQELEGAIEDFVRVHQRALDAKLPPADGPRALLKAQLAQQAAAPNRPAHWALAAAAAVVAVLAVGWFHTRQNSRSPQVVSMPDSRLTPGATLLVNRRALCVQASTKNKAVPVALQKKVFEEYGIKEAEPRAYEVDYLVTPALGGADDIHNLWPHSYTATVWNAQVKDALEDRLRDMVCEGNLDLTEAQQEIASNWIDAYKKYFHTDKPLEPQHHIQ